MAIILDEENNVVTVENQPEAKRTLFKNISDGKGGAIDEILERLDRIYPGTNSGFISSTGAVQSATADAEVYTDEFPVTPGNKVSVTLKYSQDRSMWLAYCLYDANHTFISRTMLVNSVTQKAADVSFTVPEGAYYCRLTYRSFNDATIAIDTTGQRLNDVQFAGRSLVKNGVAYIPSNDYVLLNSVTLEEDAVNITMIKDSAGNDLKLSKMLIDIELAEKAEEAVLTGKAVAKTPSGQNRLTDIPGYTLSANKKYFTTYVVDVLINKIHTIAYRAATVYNAARVVDGSFSTWSDIAYLAGTVITVSGGVKAGSSVKLYGVPL